MEQQRRSIGGAKGEAQMHTRMKIQDLQEIVGVDVCPAQDPLDFFDISFGIINWPTELRSCKGGQAQRFQCLADTEPIPPSEVNIVS